MVTALCSADIKLTYLLRSYSLAWLRLPTAPRCTHAPAGPYLTLHTAIKLFIYRTTVDTRPTPRVARTSYQHITPTGPHSTPLERRAPLAAHLPSFMCVCVKSTERRSVQRLAP